MVAVQARCPPRTHERKRRRQQQQLVAKVGSTERRREVSVLLSRKWEERKSAQIFKERTHEGPSGLTFPTAFIPFFFPHRCFSLGLGLGNGYKRSNPHFLDNMALFGHPSTRRLESNQLTPKHTYNPWRNLWRCRCAYG